MSDDLVARLREGCVLLPKRWSGDIGSDRPYGLLDEEATDRLMSEAADHIAKVEAERDAWKARADGLLAELARVLHDTGQEEEQKPVTTTFNKLMNDPVYLDAIRQACIDVLGEDPFDPEDGER